MSIEVLAESLRLAVEGSFQVQGYRHEMIKYQVAGLSKTWLDTGLYVAKSSKQTGLKVELASSYASGDIERIDEQRNNAAQAAIRGICVRAMQQAVTIENNNRKRKLA